MKAAPTAELQRRSRSSRGCSCSAREGPSDAAQALLTAPARPDDGWGGRRRFTRAGGVESPNRQPSPFFLALPSRRPEMVRKMRAW